MGITIAAWFTSTIYDDDFTLVVKKASEVDLNISATRLHLIVPPECAATLYYLLIP